MITGIKVAKLSFSTGNKVRSSNLLGFQKRSISVKNSPYQMLCFGLLIFLDIDLT